MVLHLPKIFRKIVDDFRELVFLGSFEKFFIFPQLSAILILSLYDINLIIIAVASGLQHLKYYYCMMQHGILHIDDSAYFLNM